MSMRDDVNTLPGTMTISRRNLMAGAAGLALAVGLKTPAWAQSASVSMWDAGLLASANDGVIDKENSFIYRAINVYLERHPDRAVEVTQQGGDFTAASNQFRAASIAKNGPDLKTTFAGGNVLSFEQFLEPLDDVVDPVLFEKLTGWDTVRSKYDPNGKRLALPFGGGSYFCIFYRKSLFTQAGIEPKEPANWEELYEIGDKLKQAGINPFWVANQEGYVGAWTIGALAGGLLGTQGFYDMVARRIPINCPEMITAYKAYAELYTRGLTNPDASSVKGGEAVQGFVQGKGAMMIGGGWWNGRMLSNLGDDVGAFPIPMLAASKIPGAMAGGPNNAIMLTAYSKNKEAAAHFLSFLGSAEMLDLYVEATQTEPSNHLDADPSLIVNPLLRAQAEQLKTRPQIYPFDNLMPVPVIDLFYRLNASAFVGQTTPEDVVAQLQDEFDRQPA